MAMPMAVVLLHVHLAFLMLFNVLGRTRGGPSAFTDLHRTVFRGEDAVLRCKPQGTPSFVLWRKGDDKGNSPVLIKQESDGSLSGSCNYDGSCEMGSNYSLIIRNVQIADEGRYICVFQDLHGIIGYSLTNLTTHETEACLEVKSITAMDSHSVQLPCIDCRDGPYPGSVLLVRWSILIVNEDTNIVLWDLSNNDTKAEITGNYGIKNNFSLIIKKANANYEGRYHCYVLYSDSSSSDYFIRLAIEETSPFEKVSPFMTTEPQINSGSGPHPALKVGLPNIIVLSAAGIVVLVILRKYKQTRKRGRSLSDSCPSPTLQENRCPSVPALPTPPVKIRCPSVPALPTPPVKIRFTFDYCPSPTFKDKRSQSPPSQTPLLGSNRCRSESGYSSSASHPLEDNELCRSLSDSCLSPSVQDIQRCRSLSDSCLSPSVQDIQLTEEMLEKVSRIIPSSSYTQICNKLGCDYSSALSILMKHLKDHQAAMREVLQSAMERGVIVTLNDMNNLLNECGLGRVAL